MPFGIIIAVSVLIRVLVNVATGQKTGRLSIRAGHLLFILLAVNWVILWNHPVRFWGTWVVLALFTAPSLFVRLLLVPLGLPRASYQISRLALVVWGGQRNHGSLFAAAWALSRGIRALQPQDVDWLWMRINKEVNDNKLRGPGMVALGLAHSLRGERAEARGLLQAVCVLEPAVAHRRMVFDVALDWCLADCAERGAWNELLKLVRAISEVRPFFISRRCALMRAVARRALGYEPARPWLLWTLWLLAPGRIQSFSLVRAALDFRPRSAPAAGRIRPDLGGALALHARMLMMSSMPSGPQLQTLERAWTKALESPELRTHLSSRAEALQVSEIEVTLERLGQAVRGDFGVWVTHALAAGATLGSGPLLGSAARLRVAECEDELELLHSRLAERLSGAELLTAVETWREFLALRALQEELGRVGGTSARRTANALLAPTLLTLGVRLFNDDFERGMANAIFRWLLVEAEAVGDLTQKDTLVGNIKCGAAL